MIKFLGKEYRTEQEMANLFGFPPLDISAFLIGEKPIPDIILRAHGYKRVVTTTTEIVLIDFRRSDLK